MLKHLYTSAVLLLLSQYILAQDYIEFIENKGQWNSELKYNGRIGNGQFALTANGYKVLKYDAAVQAHNHEQEHNHGKHNNTIKGHVWEVKFINSSTTPNVVVSKQTQGYSNYFIGNDASKYASNCKGYTQVTYQNIYPNINLAYYSNEGTLKYDIIAQPGADLSKLQLKYDGVNAIKVSRKGVLQIITSVGTYEEQAPYTYQYIGNTKKVISSYYTVKNNIVQFKLGDYDPTVPLIIDPTLVFSTHTGSTSDNWGFTATYGPDETFYGGGISFGAGFPVTNGAFQTSYTSGGGSAGTNVSIIKLSANGSNRIYATYLGGNTTDQPHSIICDPQGNLVIAGRTNSPNFPSTLRQGVGGGYDIFITKLNAAGSAIIGSLIIGGSNDDGVNVSVTRSRVDLQYNYGDDGRSEVNLDASGNIVLASCTQSTNFFTTAGAAQPIMRGIQDAVLIKTTPSLSAVTFSTYFGGNGHDAAYVVNVNPEDGNIYFAGGTKSNNLLGTATTPQVVQPTFGGDVDGFITVINPAGTSIIRTTYIGTALHDQVYGIQFDKFNFPYIMGISLGNFPVNNAAYSNPGSHQFIAKLSKDLSTYVYSTIFGSNANNVNISPVAFLVDRCENVYVSGWGGQVITAFPNSGTLGMPVTPDALQPNTDGKDFYYFVLERNANTQLFGSFFGGVQSNQISEHVDGGTSRFDPKGAIYQAACASCSVPLNQQSAMYPTTAGSWSAPRGGANCNLGMTKIRFNLSGVGADLRASDTSGCVPLTVGFSDVFLNAVSYEYNFGDGSPTRFSTNPNETYTYNTPGFYRARLIAIDLNSCNLRDTSYRIIRVRNDRATIDFTGIKQPPCLNLSYLFTNLSVAPAGKPFSNNSFQWNFDDGSPIITTGTAPQLKTYATGGNYNVRLYLRDTNYCNSPDSAVRIFRLSPTVKANFVTTNGCAPFTTTFANTSLAGAAFEWSFGDGGTSIATSPTYTYNTPGTYTVTLIANDPNTCNFTDTLRLPITISPTPVADFTFAPNPPLENTPTQFTNTSTGATIYNWNFGDNTTSTATNPLHQYNQTRTYNTCLIASNTAGCRDTTCYPVAAIINPVVDVATALTPNGDGVNDKVFVRGFGILTMQWRIFNRWGQLIFESTSITNGWDGTYKGALQPMEAYAYTLSIELVDGQKIKRSGNITLIR